MGYKRKPDAMTKPELTARVEQLEYENKRLALDLRKTGAELDAAKEELDALPKWARKIIEWSRRDG